MEEQNIHFKLDVTPKIKQDLSTAAVWASIVAIVGFVSAAISLLRGLMLGGFIAVIISAGIAVLLNIYLFQFGKASKKALESNDATQLDEGLSDLKTYFKIYGILVIIGLVFFVFAFLMTIISGNFIYD